MHPQQIPLINTLSTPTVHPDGSVAVVSVTRPDFAADSYVGQLWRVPLAGGAPQRITRGFRDSAPRFSPDGRLLGFLRAEPGERSQLAIVPAEGGEPMVVTDAKLGVRQFAFSADGARLAFIAAVPEVGRYGTLEGVSSRQEDPRLIRTLQFQLDGIGYTGDQRTQLFVLDVPDPRGEPPIRPVGREAKDGEFTGMPSARQLSSGDFDHHSPVWDGDDAVLVVAARHDGRDGDLRADLYRFGLDGAEPTRLTDAHSGTTVTGSPVVIGERVYFLGGDCGTDGLAFFGENPGVHVVSRAGGELRRLTDAETVHVNAELAADGAGVLTVDLVRGSGVVIRVDGDGVTDRWELPGSAISVAAAAGVRVAVSAGAATPGELVLVERPEPALTDFAAGLRAEATPVAPLDLVAVAPDGYPVHGWVVRPQGEGPHPVLLMIHGGPFAAYPPAFFDEAQVYAGAGYAVVMCNPRGSAGYGQAHAKAVQGAFGDRDVADVLAFLDQALTTVPGLDAGRVGVMGGSYGGYLTAWLTAHEHRFAAAIVERAYLDPRSFVGAADIGWYFPSAAHGDVAAMDAQSPLLLVDRVRTPTLVIHSEQDLRCPLATAQRYYTELKQRGVDAELLVFPGEGHELSRSGTPQHRQTRFEHVLRWWARHLAV